MSHLAPLKSNVTAAAGYIDDAREALTMAIAQLNLVTGMGTASEMLSLALHDLGAERSVILSQSARW